MRHALAIVAALSWFYFITPKHVGDPQIVTMRYTTHTACQDWEGGCGQAFGPYPFGLAGSGGFCVGVNLQVETECGHDNAPAPSQWCLTVYPADGGIFAACYPRARACQKQLSLLHSWRVNSSAGCIFEGNAHE